MRNGSARDVYRSPNSQNIEGKDEDKNVDEDDEDDDDVVGKKRTPLHVFSR